MNRDYEGDLATLRAARRDVVQWLTEQGADEGTKERAALIVSELTSNAIQAAPGSTYNVYIARLDADTASITVRNAATGGLPLAREEWRPTRELSLRELSERGRGLAIVESLSEEVVIEHDRDEVVVTARLHIDPERP